MSHGDDVIEAAPAHRAYYLAAYWEVRVAMMQTWVDLLDQFRALPPEKSAPPRKK